MGLIKLIPHITSGETINYFASNPNLPHKKGHSGTPVSRLIIDDEKNEPLELRDNHLFTEMLQHMDVSKVKSIYLSETHPHIEGSSFGEEDQRIAAAPVTDLIIICENVYDIFYNKRTHIKTIRPFGYQKPVEFYAPKYDTPESRENLAFDMRTTIHWQPVVQTDSTGIASFEFYTADAESSYTVIIEGVTAEGKIVRQEAKLWRRDDEKSVQMSDRGKNKRILKIISR